MLDRKTRVLVALSVAFLACTFIIKGCSWELGALHVEGFRHGDDAQGPGGLGVELDALALQATDEIVPTPCSAADLEPLALCVEAYCSCQACDDGGCWQTCEDPAGTLLDCITSNPVRTSPGHGRFTSYGEGDTVLCGTFYHSLQEPCKDCIIEQVFDTGIDFNETMERATLICGEPV